MRVGVTGIKDSKSTPTILICGVPQGSVLGPYLFNIYSSPVSVIMHSHSLSYQIFADDKQNYISSNPNVLGPNLARLHLGC